MMRRILKAVSRRYKGALGKGFPLPSALLLTLGLAVFLPPFVYAGGRKQIITKTAEGIDIWKAEFDVAGMKPGTYNIIVNAKDAAGNIGVSGPYNIKLDPMAGLPETQIIYPEHNQVVRGDVHIVGVAASRYGLKQVLIKIDNGEYRPLEGREYWDLRIPWDELGEGKHSISVKAIDVNELTGPEEKIDFVVDVIPPSIELTSHEIGDLIAGRVKVTGRIDDNNGIEAAFLSTDGVHFTRLGLSNKRGDSGKHFSITIRSKNYEDGPLVYYIRVINKTGYSVTKPFLFWVNNYPPQIEILSPGPKEQTWGRTQVTGRVISGVGLTQFYYEWAGVREEIPLRPGDPFWAVVFPISMAHNRAVPFRVTAVDKSGNTTTVIQRFQDTRRFRTPTLTITNPQPPRLGAINLDYDQSIYGHIEPGFFPWAIIIEGEIEFVMAQPGFRIPPRMIPEGRSTLQMWAIDEDETTGQVINLTVNRTPPPGGIEPEESPLIIESPEEYSWFTDSVTIEGFIDGFGPGQTLEYRRKWDEPWRPAVLDSEGAFEVTISLADIPEGPVPTVPIEFRTIRGGRADVPYYIPVNKYTTMPRVRFLTPQERFGPVHRSMTTSGVITYIVPLERISYSLDGVTFESLDFTAKHGRAWFNHFFDYSAMYYNGETLTIRVEDRAGNIVEVSPEITFDDSGDPPTIMLNSPLDEDLVTGDFEISGLSFSDVGIAAVHWRILSPTNPWDAPETTLSRRSSVAYEKIETEQNFFVPLTLDDVRDGENILEIFAEDIYGLAGKLIRRNFKVSTAAPDTTVIDPATESWVRGNITVHGTSFDLNGIAQILVSMDNGISYQRADYESRQHEPSIWNISLNTKAYADGVYSMLIRTVDTYGIASFSNAVINIDNTPPHLDIGSPRDGDSIGLVLPITGQVYDNLAIENISIELVNINDPNLQMAFDLPGESVIMESRDVSSFPDGDYTLKITAFDRSGNETSVIRNITIIKARAASEVAFINPMPGIDHAGPLIVSGRISGAVIPEQVTLMMDGRSFSNVDVNRYGIFRYDLPENRAWMGEPVVFTASFQAPDGEHIVSYDHLVKLNSFGPVVMVDSHKDGDVITGRPWISGRAFIVAPGTRADAEADARRGGVHGVTRVELSFDNGRSFYPAEGGNNWQFRLETAEFNPGTLPIVVKAGFQDGRVAIRRILLYVDPYPPVVKTIGPNENSSHRDKVEVYGSVTDNFDIDYVEVSLRPGDKFAYAVPGFIQGLYFDASILGGYIWSTGIGLTFFDDNVKLQANFAQAPAGRYEGWAIGGKVLANVYTTKLSEWFGPDWDFWTTSLTLGAHFSYFLMGDDDDPVWMGEFLGQWEIIKADMNFFYPSWKYFKSISFYTEFGVWFAPSDVDMSNDPNAWRVLPRIAFGLRLSLF